MEIDEIKNISDLHKLCLENDKGLECPNCEKLNPAYIYRTFRMDRLGKFGYVCRNPECDFNIMVEPIEGGG